MTLFDLVGFSEIKEPGWNYNTLRPPLKIREVNIDIKNQWQSYCQSELTFVKKIKFLILRIFQRVAYNFGWVLAINKYKKVLRRSGFD
ncbi:hypothetical protein LCGC14_1944550 [marine sediment metagenome]|uniref:Uncharacterized protein n=1 Tax=marine sediment metagenome TaxID=412755 RepID=A0A0F9G7Q5_9ZZZZ